MFIVALIIMILGLLATVAAVVTRSSNTRLTAAVLMVLGLLGMVIASLSSVPTRNVGIVTQFNKPTGRTTGAGLKWHAPWQSIDDWDASRNTFNRLGSCLWVSVSGGRACIAVQIEWSADPAKAPAEWAAYKKVDGIDGGRFGTFVARRVNPQMDSAITTAFTRFNPLGQVDQKTGALVAPDLNADYKDDLTRTLEANLGGAVRIESIAFGTPTYDDATTKAISDFGKKVLEGRNLAVDKANAITRAEITKTDASVDQVARCLQIAEKLGKEPGLCMTRTTVTRPVS